MKNIFALTLLFCICSCGDDSTEPQPQYILQHELNLSRDAPLRYIYNSEGEHIYDFKDAHYIETDSLFAIRTKKMFPNDQYKYVMSKAGFYRDSDRLFMINIVNNSSWRIEEIDIMINIYSSMFNTLESKILLTAIGYSEYAGIPMLTTEYVVRLNPPHVAIFSDVTNYFTWSILEIRGSKYIVH